MVLNFIDILPPPQIPTTHDHDPPLEEDKSIYNMGRKEGRKSCMDNIMYGCQKSNKRKSFPFFLGGRRKKIKRALFWGVWVWW